MSLAPRPRRGQSDQRRLGIIVLDLNSARRSPAWPASFSPAPSASTSTALDAGTTMPPYHGGEKQPRPCRAPGARAILGAAAAGGTRRQDRLAFEHQGQGAFLDACADTFRNQETLLHSFATFTQLSEIEGSTLRAPEGLPDDRADAYALATQAQIASRRFGGGYTISEPEGSLLYNAPESVMGSRREREESITAQMEKCDFDSNVSLDKCPEVGSPETSLIAADKPMRRSRSLCSGVADRSRKHAQHRWTQRSTASIICASPSGSFRGQSPDELQGSLNPRGQLPVLLDPAWSHHHPASHRLAGDVELPDMGFESASS